MRIVISGGTGFVGRALIQHLLRQNHEVTVLTRSPSRAWSRLGASVVAVDVEDDNALQRAVEGAGAVVNLAGESVVQGRWTEAAKNRIWNSRVTLTKRLVRAVVEAHDKPSVLVSASAVGFYGDTGEEEVDETSKPSTGFLAELCTEWEAAACVAEHHGVRVVRLRLGTVLGHDGGMMRRLLPLFRHRLGGTLGGGEQWMSWIHIDDLVAVVEAALFREDLRGAVNAVSPAPVRNKQFTGVLSRLMGKPAYLPVPASLIRLVFGDGADVLLEGTRAQPRRLLNSSFTFGYPEVEQALADILKKSSSSWVIERPDSAVSVERGGL